MGKALLVSLIIVFFIGAVLAFSYFPEVWRPSSSENIPEVPEDEIAVIKTRTFNPDTAKLFITPNASVIKQTVDNIAKNPLIFDWIEIRDWVAKNIEYVKDSEAYGESDYWQLPRETLSLRTGDCEDFSVLLCSLLRANGWDENEVYVVVGENYGRYHAWVKLNVDVVGWQNIEPQEGALNTLIGDSISLSGYTAKYYFNDVYFETI